MNIAKTIRASMAALTGEAPQPAPSPAPVVVKETTAVKKAREALARAEADPDLRIDGDALQKAVDDASEALVLTTSGNDPAVRRGARRSLDEAVTARDGGLAAKKAAQGIVAAAKRLLDRALADAASDAASAERRIDDALAKERLAVASELDALTPNLGALFAKLIDLTEQMRLRSKADYSTVHTVANPGRLRGAWLLHATANGLPCGTHAWDRSKPVPSMTETIAAGNTELLRT